MPRAGSPGESPPGTKVVSFLAHKEGFAVASRLADPMLATASRDIKLRLARPAGFSAVLVDGAGKPVAGATVRVEMLAQPDEHKDGDRTGFGVEYTYLRREVIGGSPHREASSSRPPTRPARSPSGRSPRTRD